jgi:prepilin-type N-terminal cleavage/methylation domain-containing protein
VRSRFGRGRNAARGVTLIELMVVVMIISILAVLAIPSLVGNTRDLAVYQAAQRVAELVQGGRSRALATGAAHSIVFSTDSAGSLGALPGKFAVQQAQRTIGVTPRVPVSSCRSPGAFGMNMGAVVPVTTVVAPNTSPVVDNMVFGSDQRFIEYDIRVAGFRGPSVPSGPEMWICFTPTGRAYIAPTAALLTGSPALLSPISVDIARFEGGARRGLTRSVVVTPGSAPRIFSSQL